MSLVDDTILLVVVIVGCSSVVKKVDKLNVESNIGKVFVVIVWVVDVVVDVVVIVVVVVVVTQHEALLHAVKVGLFIFVIVIVSNIFLKRIKIISYPSGGNDVTQFNSSILFDPYKHDWFATPKCYMK